MPFLKENPLLGIEDKMRKRNVQNGKYLFINGLLKISFLHTFALEDSSSFTTNANIYTFTWLQAAAP